MTGEPMLPHLKWCRVPKLSSEKGQSAKSNSAKIKPVALAIIELRLSEGIRQAGSQSVSQSLENSVK